MEPTADEIIRRLELKPHPEGGFYRESYRSGESVSLGGAEGKIRSASTCIFYLLTPGTHSKLHRLTQDEIFHFYLGDPVTWLLLKPTGEEKVVLGNGFLAGEIVQMVVKAGTWFGGWLNEGGRFALMGTTVAPGFEFSDFFLANRQELLGEFPKFQEEIIRLT